MELGSSCGAHGDNQVQSTWKFDAWTIQGGRKYSPNVEFVEFVSNISVRVSLRLDSEL
jgi:hypothetical protein